MRYVIGLALLGGCGAAESWEGVWFLERPLLDTSACADAIDENYDDAEAPDAIGVSGDWTIDQQSELSAEAFFVQVLAGKHDDVFVVVGDEVYPGVAERNLLTVQWTGTIDDHYEESHDDGYRFAIDATGTVDEELVLARDKSTDGVYGTWAVTSTTTTAFAETDEWRIARVGVTYTQIPSWGYLVGDRPENTADRDECDGGECSLAFTTTCDGASDVTGRYAGTDGAGVFDGVEDAGQTAGTGAWTGGYYDYGYDYGYDG